MEVAMRCFTVYVNCPIDGVPLRTRSWPGDDPQAELMARREVDYIRSHSPDLNPEVVEEEKFWGRA
jgi:hypothetical protein